jgi:hypothetical protein
VVTILDNLLAKHTKPFDVVVDPFAGGGSTVDLCKKRCQTHPHAARITFRLNS